MSGQPSEKKISVIVPVYRVEETLARCVDSLLAQTYQNLEILLVDDGSPDRCGAMCDGFAAKDARIRVIHQKNGGLSAARNTGLDAATGALIGFLDSDDYVEPELFSSLAAAMARDGSEIAICGYYLEKNGKSTPVCMDDARVCTSAEALSLLYGEAAFHNFMWNKLYDAALFSGCGGAPADASAGGPARPHPRVQGKDALPETNAPGRAGQEARGASCAAAPRLHAAPTIAATSAPQAEPFAAAIRFPEGKNYEDIPVQYRLFERAGRVSILPVPLHHYVQRKGSIVGGRRLSDELDACEAFLARYRDVSARQPDYAPGLLLTLFKNPVRHLLFTGLFNRPAVHRALRPRWRALSAFLAEHKAALSPRLTPCDRALLSLAIADSVPLHYLAAHLAALQKVWQRVFPEPRPKKEA